MSGLVFCPGRDLVRWQFLGLLLTWEEAEAWTRKRVLGSRYYALDSGIVAGVVNSVNWCWDGNPSYRGWT